MELALPHQKRMSPCVAIMILCGFNLHWVDVKYPRIPWEIFSSTITLNYKSQVPESKVLQRDHFPGAHHDNFGTVGVGRERLSTNDQQR